MKSFSIKMSRKSSDFFIIATLYTLAFGLYLLNGGLFWDDWCLYNQFPATRIHLFKDSGFFLYWPAYLHNILLSVSFGVYLERFLIFVSFLFAGIFIYCILDKIKYIDERSRFFLVIIFMLFPANFSRIPICSIHYSLCFGMFFLGIWLVSIYLSSKNWILRVISLLCFIIAFSTNSFCFYYIILFFYIFYIEKDTVTNFMAFVKKGFSYTDFIILPVIFWIVKDLFFQTSGLYKGNYNLITMNNVILFPIKSIQVLFQSFINIIINPFVSLKIIVILSIILAFVLMFIINRINYLKEYKSQRENLSLIIIGLLIFLAGIFPYIAVGKWPDDYLGFSSRHQLLITLGLSFIVIFSLNIIFNEFKFRPQLENYFYSIIVIFFVIIDFNACLSYQKLWLKQVSLMENFCSSDIIKNNTTFLVQDYFIEYIYENEFYGFTGMFKKVFKDETRFAEYFPFFKTIKNYKVFLNYPQYNMNNYIPSNPNYIIVINAGDYSLTKKRTLFLTIKKFLFPDKFKNEIRNIIKLSYVKISRQLH